MSTMIDLDSIQVKAAMSHVKFTVSPSQKLEVAAKLLRRHGVNAALVVDETGKCVGIVTSSDLVRFQAEFPEADSLIDHGMTFETTRRPVDGRIELVSHPFDEIQRHMTRSLQTIEQTQSLRFAARVMREQRIHHLVVLDDSQRPIGILSSLDILSKLDG